MRGLDPRIHSSVRASGGMDRRVKPGDDNENAMDPGAATNYSSPASLSRAAPKRMTQSS